MSDHIDVQHLSERAEGPFGVALMASGFSIIGLFVAAAAAWGVLAPIDTAVVAPGILNVASNVRTIQHLEGGVVDEILVQDGDSVEAGDVLIRLRSTHPASVLNELQAQYYEARALEARLTAELEGADLVTYPPELTAAGENDSARAAMANQESIFSHRRLLFLDRIGILERTQEALEREIEGLQEQAGATERALVLAEEELLSAQHLSEQSLVTRPRVIALERDKAQLQGALGSYRASIGSAHQRIEEAKLRLSELKASSSTEIVEQLRASRARAYELAQRSAAAQDVMSRTEVHAPISGEVVGMQIHTLGGVVGGGQPLLDIVPRGDRLIIHAMIDPLDIDSVSVGMPATVWVSAVNRRSSAALEGEVKVISADRLMDGQTGLPYYLARVELMPETLERAAVPIQQGMTVEVMIRTGTWTAWEYISAPIRRNLSRALRES